MPVITAARRLVDHDCRLWTHTGEDRDPPLYAHGEHTATRRELTHRGPVRTVSQPSTYDRATAEKLLSRVAGSNPQHLISTVCSALATAAVQAGRNRMTVGAPDTDNRARTYLEICYAVGPTVRLDDTCNRTRPALAALIRSWVTGAFIYVDPAEHLPPLIAPAVTAAGDWDTVTHPSLRAHPHHTSLRDFFTAS